MGKQDGTREDTRVRARVRERQPGAWGRQPVGGGGHGGPFWGRGRGGKMVRPGLRVSEGASQSPLEVLSRCCFPFY